MTDSFFALHIFLLMLALAASYAVLMSILKKDPSALWLKGETLTALASGALALSFTFEYFTGDDMLFMLAALLTILGIANALGLAIMQFKNVTGSDYPKSLVSITRSIGIFMFASFTASFLIELVALGR